MKTDSTFEHHLLSSPEQGEEDYDLGSASFSFHSLKPLYALIPPPVLNEPGKKVAQPWEMKFNIQAPVEEVYDVISNFERRLEWNKGVSQFEYNKDEVNRVGTKHRCVVNDKILDFETITSDFGGKLVYGERTADAPVVDLLNSYFIMEPVNSQETSLTIEIHPFTRSPFKKLLIPLLKRFAWKQLQNQFSLIKEVAERSGK